MNITVEVPETRLAEFYIWFGQWLAQTPVELPLPTNVGSVTLADWTSEDEELAASVWSKLSPVAKQLLGYLVDHPDRPISWSILGEHTGLPTPFAVAGALAWPGRYCYAVGKNLPVSWTEGPTGADYWMSSLIADLFRRVRDA